MHPTDIVYRGWIEVLGQGVEAWKEDHDQAMNARNLEELIPCALVLRDMMRNSLKRDFERLFANKETVPQWRGQIATELNRNNLKIFSVLAQHIRRAEDQGYEVEGARDFDRAFEDVRRLSDDFTHRWPMFDLKELEGSRAQAARGAFASDEDVWRELQG